MKKVDVTVHEGSHNVYADVGHAQAASMKVRSDLVIKISRAIKKRGYSQTKVAELTGIPQPKLSEILRGRFRGVSEERLMRCLAALGHEVRIVVVPLKDHRRGHVRVAA